MLGTVGDEPTAVRAEVEQERTDGDERSLPQHLRLATACEDRLVARARLALHDVRAAGSTPSASAGRPSVTRLIQRICSGSSAGTGASSAVVKTIETSLMLHESRNRMNLRRLSKTTRPSCTASNDRGEVVVGKHHVGGLAGDVGPDLAHRDADVGALERGRIVDAVAGHRDDLAPALERVDDAQLVLRVDARVDRGCPRRRRRARRRSWPRVPARRRRARLRGGRSRGRWPLRSARGRR